MSLEKPNNNTMIIKYQNTDNVVEDICSIIESARNYAYQSINIALVERNWFIGYRIAEEELKGENRADYGTEILKKLSKELKKEYGKGFELRNLYYFLQFYKTFPNILHSASAFYYKYQMKKLENGMKRKLLNNLGVLELYKGIYLHNIIIDY